MFVLDEYHKAHHHYVKVVGTLYEVPQRWGKEDMFTYQMLPEVRRKREEGRASDRFLFCDIARQIYLFIHILTFLSIPPHL